MMIEATCPTDSLPPLFAVAYFNCKTDNRPDQHVLTWEILKNSLTQFEERQNKDGRLWSPVSYRTDFHFRYARRDEPIEPTKILDETGAHWRMNENVDSVSCLVLDFDSGFDPSDFMESWEGLEFVVHSTHSSTPAFPKWRAVFPLAAPVPAKDWPTVHAKLSEHLSHGTVDPSCKDASRMYYLPAHPPGTASFHFAGKGAFLDPANFPNLPSDEPNEVAKFSTNVRPGDDFEQRATWEEILEPHGWKVDRRGYRGQTLWTRPGKASGTSARTGDGTVGDRFYCWSSEAGVPCRVLLTKFSLYSHLNHGGNHSAAAKALKAEGYGNNKKIECKSLYTNPNQLTPTVAEIPALDDLALYGVAGDFVRAVAPHTEAGAPALLFQFLTMAGSVFGRHAFFQVEGTRHYPNLYTVVVGTTNSGRKGTSYQHVHSLFRDAFPPWADRCLKTGLSSGEGLIHHVRDPKIKYGTEQGSDVPEENVLDEGVSDKRLTVFEAEFARVLKACGRENCTLSAVLRTLWDTDSAATLTKQNADKTSGAHVSLIGHITPQELRTELNNTESANGFGNRILWVYTNRSQLLPNGGEIPLHALDNLKAKIVGAADAARSRERVHRAHAAEATWEKAYADLSKDAPGLAGLLSARGAPQVMRLALIYALLDECTEIQEAHLVAALAAWKYCRDSVRYIFDNATGNADADRILGALVETGDDGLSRTEISGLFRNNKDARSINDALRLLETNGHARRKTPPPDQDAGRPPEIWRAT